jgi:uncharacterized iron-regulated protein
MMRQLAKKDMILFGEPHNNTIAHCLQIEITDDLNVQKPMILGAKMFDAHDQKALNDYLSVEINAKALATLACLCTNPRTDDAPLVKLAKGKEPHCQPSESERQRHSKNLSA